MNIENLLCDKESSLRIALKVIDKGGKGIAFIVDQNKILVGILTDGDIRRALINKLVSLEVPVKCFMNNEYVFSYKNENFDKIFSKFSKKIKYIPIIDSEGVIIDCYEYSNFINIPISSPELSGNELKYLNDAVLSTWISSTGKYIVEFESNFSSYCDMDYGVAVSNGTVALHLALMALDIGKGDEVIVPDLTFAATINAVLYTGATPVIVDIEENSWCISPDEIEKAITSKTKAIIPVHLYGQPCDMHRIMKIAEKYNLYVVEDCAEAHGAEFAGKRVGSFGIINCFSFYANKVITTGEGGMCLTNDLALNDKMKLLRDHGMSKEIRYYHTIVGFNYRMTNLQAAIGVAQLERIDEIQRWRYELEEKYRKEFEKIPNVVLQENNLPKRKKITWLVSILLNEKRRDYYMNEFRKYAIDIRPFFISLSDMDIYKQYLFSNKNSKKIAKRGISLPTTNQVNEQMIELIAKILMEGTEY